MAYKNCAVVAKAETLDTPVALDYEHVLESRHPYRYSKKRPCFWYSPYTDDVIMPDGTTGNIPASTALTTLLEKIEQYTQAIYDGKKKSATLYLAFTHSVGKRPHKREWFQVYRGWKQEKLLWEKLQGYYSHNGFEVRLYGNGNYFGDEKDIHAMHEALNGLESKLAHAFHVDEKQYKLVGDTPAQTGRELLLISLPKEKLYPRLPHDLLWFIKHNLGAGRVEWFTPKREVLQDGIWLLDGRFMYASQTCLSYLPNGACYRDSRNEFIGGRRKSDGKLVPFCPAFYKVTVTVPDNWQHIGLIKAPGITQEGNQVYPNTPGETFTNWIEAYELALALDNPLHIPWNVHIHERLFWPDARNMSDPLNTWRKNLVELRERLEQEDSTIADLQKDAVRSIVLHLIGSFYTYISWEEKFTPRPELPSSEPLIKPRLYDILGRNSYKIISDTKEGIEWKEARFFSGKQRQAFIHPEWSTSVWGRARAMLAENALRIPYEDIVYLATDCIWSASKPDWVEREDAHQPGCFRAKDYLKGPITWPIDSGEAYRMAIRRNLAKGDTSMFDVGEPGDELEEGA